MTKYIKYSAAVILISTAATAQKVGIGTVNPQAVLHVDAQKNNPPTGAPSAAQQLDDVVITSDGKMGIGTITPSATLEIATRDNTAGSTAQEGIVIPAVSLAKLNAMTGPTEGNLVYVNDVTDAQRNALTNYVVNPGFYKYNGSLWVRLMTYNEYTGMNVKSLVYPRPSNAYYPDDTKVLNCGRLQFRIGNVSNNYGRPQVRMINGNATINYGIMIEYDRDNKLYGAPSLDLNSTNWSNMDQANDSRLGYGRMELVTTHITINGDPDYYRVKFFWANNLWSVVCTRF